MKSVSGLLTLVALAFSVAYAQSWRALIVYTNYLYVDQDPSEGRRYLSGTNLHSSVFAPLFDEMNDIYANSGTDVRAEIAGVIWDKTFTSTSAQADLYAITQHTGGMAQYVDMLDEYAADILILRDGPITTNAGIALFHSFGWSAGGYTYPSAASIGYGALWIGVDYPWVWVHEAGHTHNATHCDGYRMVINGALAFVPYNGSGGVAGFNDVMSYQEGNPDCTDPAAFVYDDGQHGFLTTKTYTLSNPSMNFSLWLSPWWLSYPIGITTPTNHNATAIHNTWASAVRGYRNTPSNLTITSGMSMEQFDYADFRATGTVTINPGFRAENVSQLRITVGSNALTKKGVDPENPAPEAKTLPQAFSVRLKVDRQGTLLTGTLPKESHLFLRVLKVTGEIVYERDLGAQDAGNFQRGLEFVPKKNGLYLFQVRAGKNTVVRRVYWQQ